MSHSLCDRCSSYFSCSLNYDGKPCRKNRDVEPTNFDKIKDMSLEELAFYLSEWASSRLAWERSPEKIEEWLKGDKEYE